MDPLATQQYCLKWNNHQSNLLAVFEDLLNSEAFVDVTLACDGMHLKAHKMVLSACSPYFQSLLYDTPDRHPIVFMKDVRFTEMKALLEFMYRGEVSIDQERLTSLLKVAESLRIKGLIDVNNDQRSQEFSSPDEDFTIPAGQTNNHHHHLHTLSQNNLGQQHSQHYGFGFVHSLAIDTGDSNSFVNKHAPTSSSSPPLHNGQSFLGPKRKRGRPRRLSGTEAVPMASGVTENEDIEAEDMTICNDEVE